MVKFTRSRYFALGLLLALAFGSMAATVSYFGAGAADQLGISLITLISGEDQTNNVMRVEGQFSYCLDDADIVCKAAPGFLHTVSCWGEDAAATAGRVQIRDATAAGAGTVVWQQEFAAAIATPMTWVADIVMTTGIVIDWDTTADVFCTVSYR